MPMCVRMLPEGNDVRSYIYYAYIHIYEYISFNMMRIEEADDKNDEKQILYIFIYEAYIYDSAWT